jgi:hypothetical protein
MSEEVEEVCREQVAKVAVILQLIREEAFVVEINFHLRTLSSSQATAITLRLKIRSHLGNNLLIM